MLYYKDSYLAVRSHAPPAEAVLGIPFSWGNTDGTIDKILECVNSVRSGVLVEAITTRS